MKEPKLKVSKLKRFFKGFKEILAQVANFFSHW